MQTKNQRRKKKKKKRRAARRLEQEQREQEQKQAAKQTKTKADPKVEVEYVPEEVEITDPQFRQFQKIFEAFQVCNL